MPKQTFLPGALIWTLLSITVVVLDQLTKQWASSTFDYATPEALMPFINFTLLHNSGAAFSFLADAGGWQRWFFTALALFVSIILVIWLATISARRYCLSSALALVLGGALGNVWDRIAYGYVIDFIDVYYQNWHWPAFNIADMAISMGMVLLIMDVIFYRETENT